MVDPLNFTNFSRTDVELEETVLFGILVANKNALTTARLLDNFLRDHALLGITPFAILRSMDLTVLTERLRQYHFGCYNNKAKGIYQLVRSGINLRTCTTDDLEAIHSIGRKTSRFFILHTRPDARCIPLDTHILHFLRDLGYAVPKATPQSKKRYKEIENKFLMICDNLHVSPADLDLYVWKYYSGNDISDLKMSTVTVDF